MIRLGFIGTGGYAQNHLEGFAALQKAEGVQIAGLADPSSEALQRANQLVGPVPCFNDYRQLIDMNCLDGVIISAPIGWHEVITLAALQRDLPVLLEKPPVALLSQLERLIAADARQRVLVGFQHIYSQGIRTLKQAIVEGTLGSLVRLGTWCVWPRSHAYYQRAGWAGQLVHHGQYVFDGPVTNACAHFLNNLLFLAGGDAAAYARPEIVQGELYRARPIPGYDTGCVSGRLTGGVPFTAAFTHCSPTVVPACTAVQGTRGTVTLTANGTTITWPDGRTQDCDDGRMAMRRAFLRLCRGDGSENLTPLRSMRSYLEVTNLMLQSAGGIRTLTASQGIHKPDEADAGIYTIDGIAEALSQVGQHGESLTEAGIPWARPGRPLTPAALSTQEILRLLHGTPVIEPSPILSHDPVLTP